MNTPTIPQFRTMYDDAILNAQEQIARLEREHKQASENRQHWEKAARHIRKEMESFKEELRLHQANRSEYLLRQLQQAHTQPKITEVPTAELVQAEASRGVPEAVAETTSTPVPPRSYAQAEQAGDEAVRIDFGHQPAKPKARRGKGAKK